MFLVDTEQGRIISDEELKQQIATEHAYQDWLDANLVHFEDLPDLDDPQPAYDHAASLQRLQAFGYSFEDLRINIGPMAVNGIQPVGSMGTDTPLAVLSDKPQLLYNYFKQLFAQVTNPPIDPIREELITSTTLTLGSEGNLVEPQPVSCRQLRLPSPILSNGELEKLRRLDQDGLRVTSLPILFKAGSGRAGLEQALEALYKAADGAIADGATILILSDKGVDREHAPIPALLGLVRPPPSSHPGRHPDAGRPRPGVRRTARSPPLLPAARLRHSGF